MIKSVKLLKIDGMFSSYKVTLQNDDELCVPKDEANTDYQNILQWVADGNTIEEAD